MSDQASDEIDVGIEGIHPLGWVAGGLLFAAVIFHIVGTKYLIGNFSWWHWATLAILLAASLRPIVLYRLSRRLDTIPAVTGTLAWIFAWTVFVVQLLNVVTRYGNRLVERDILYGQVTSVA